MFFVGLIKQIIERQEISRTAEVESLRALVDKLTNDIIEMKREGFTKSVSSVQEYQRDLLSDEIMEAVESVSDEGTTLHTEMMEYARAMILTDTPEDVVADRIMKGGSFEEFD